MDDWDDDDMFAFMMFSGGDNKNKNDNGWKDLLIIVICLMSLIGFYFLFSPQ